MKRIRLQRPPLELQSLGSRNFGVRIPDSVLFQHLYGHVLADSQMPHTE